MPTLVPTFPTPLPLSTRRNRRSLIYFAQAPLWDFALGDFVTDAAGKIVIADGYKTWQQWCIKTLMTQQAAFPIYSRRHGLDLSLSFAVGRSRLVQEAELTRRVRYALMRTRRTVDVVDFEYEYQEQYRIMSCTPVPAPGAPIPPGSLPWVLRQNFALAV